MPSSGAFSRRAVARFLTEWLEVVERDRSHPCVVAWLLFNESWGVPALAQCQEQRELVAGAYHLTRALDPTRPVIGNDGWERVRSDIWEFTTTHWRRPSWSAAMAATWRIPGC